MAYNFTKRTHILPSAPLQSGGVPGILRVGKREQSLLEKDNYFCLAVLEG